MANTASAKKRIRSSERKRIRNQLHRSRARTQLRRAKQLIAEGELVAAQEAVQSALGSLDRAVARGVIHKNSAARRKARLMRRLRRAQEEAG
ncbi:MAG: 30S ribosomal protein S20 [Anaerolineae bacterium]